MRMISLARPVFNEEMKEAAINAMQNEHFVMGESVFKFEEALARYFGARHAITTGSGSHALQFACMVLGAEKITTTPMSFIATANSIIHAGRQAGFCDIDERTGNIDLSRLPKSEAVMPVHLYGNPADMERLIELKDAGVKIIEDACQAHGAAYNGRKIGTFGDMGCFSFYTTKNLTVCGDGGAVITDNDEMAEKIRMLRDVGRAKGDKYRHTVLGFTSRLNTVNAAIGLVQLKHLDKHNGERKIIANYYRNNLPPEIPLKDNGGVNHLFVIKTEKRDAVLEYLKANSIEAGIHYPIPIHMQEPYLKMGFFSGQFPACERFCQKILSLPIYPDMKFDDLRFVVEKVNEALEEV